jgi:hypothetical protein
MKLDTPSLAQRWRLGRCIIILAAAGLLADEHAAGAAELPTLATLSATRQRPLFAANRRAPTEETARVASKPQRQQPDMSLNAIVYGSDMQMALLKRSKEAKPVAVTIGSEIDGWSVSEIAPRYVILSVSGRSFTLEFLKRGNPPLPVGPTRRADAAR